jgi:hypothetical protein
MHIKRGILWREWRSVESLPLLTGFERFLDEIEQVSEVDKKLPLFKINPRCLGD